MNIAIRIDDLGKRYTVSHDAPGTNYKTLRESLMGLASAPLRRLRGGYRNQRPTDFWALRDVNLEIASGEVVGIIGRNGAGKSTLLKVLSRIVKPTTGRAEICGRVGSLLEVGTGFHPELTGRENIYLNGAILGMSRREIDRNFEAIVDFSGVSDFLDIPIKRYSSGMQVRLAFSVSAHLEPEILIVDEVLAVGDAEFQRKCLSRMESVARSGRTILFVSHNMAAIEGLCHRGVVMDGGRVAFHGSQAEAIRRYMEVMESQLPRGRLMLDDTALNGLAPPVRIVGAEITSGADFDPVGYCSGAPLEFRVRCRASRQVIWPSLGIGIDNGLGQRIVTLHTDFGNCSREGKALGEFEFSCRMSGLVLRPGDYRIKLSLEGNGGALHVIEEAMTFTILPTDYFRNGGNIGRGMVLCDQSWEMRGLES